MMRIFVGFEDLPKLRKPVVTVGSYDGVHRGHMALLDKVMELSRANDGDSVVVTFSPHPREIIDKEGVKLLTTPGEKAELLEKAGIGNLVIIPFDVEFSKTSYHDFVKGYLVDRIGMTDFVAGYNHHFGAGKHGGPESIVVMAQQLGFRFHPVERQQVEGSKVSSTVIRHNIEKGDMAAAAKLLGYDYFVTCDMRKNCVLVPESHSKLFPSSGVYSVSLRFGDQSVEDRLVVTKRGNIFLSACGTEKASASVPAGSKVKLVFV